MSARRRKYLSIPHRSSQPICSRIRASPLSRDTALSATSVPSGWDTPGFFSGDASNLDDLVCCWNLRASDIPLLFVDVRHLERYGGTAAPIGETTRAIGFPPRPHFH